MTRETLTGAWTSKHTSHVGTDADGRSLTNDTHAVPESRNAGDPLSVPRAVPRLQFEGLQFKWRGCGAQVGERN